MASDSLLEAARLDVARGAVHTLQPWCVSERAGQEGTSREHRYNEHAEGIHQSLESRQTFR
jgi:hypothetical protein